MEEDIEIMNKHLDKKKNKFGLFTVYSLPDK